MIETTFPIAGYSAAGDLLVTIRVETDAIADAADLIRKIRDTLRHRHGDEFRALARKIEALADEDAEPNIQEIPSDSEERGRYVISSMAFIATPPQAWTDIIAEALQLGVI